MNPPPFAGPNPPTIHDAVRRLREGGLVAFPTETVYGLGADALNPDAVRRVFEAKGRPARNPLIVHVRGPEAARALVTHWPAEADRLARAFWPGPLTLVLPRSPIVPDLVTAGGPNVALRCPDHPLALALLFEFDGPLVGPSANRSGYISPTRAAHVRAEFPDDRVMVLDGGRGSARIGIESTVLSLALPTPAILRPGAISAADIARILGVEPSIAASEPPSTTAHGPLPAPGQLQRHYAPRTPTSLLTTPDLRRLLDQPHAPTAILARTDLAHLATTDDLLLPMPAEPEDYAASLYESLREADAAGLSCILIEHPPLAPPHDSGLWLAITDRLRRACAPAD